METPLLQPNHPWMHDYCDHYGIKLHHEGGWGIQGVRVTYTSLRYSFISSEVSALVALAGKMIKLGQLDSSVLIEAAGRGFVGKQSMSSDGIETTFFCSRTQISIKRER